MQIRNERYLAATIGPVCATLAQAPEEMRTVLVVIDTNEVLVPGFLMNGNQDVVRLLAQRAKVTSAEHEGRVWVEAVWAYRHARDARRYRYVRHLLGHVVRAMEGREEESGEEMQ